MKYLTPTTYRLADDGIQSLEKMTDETIARYINRAEAAIDAYIGFDARLGGFEPHSGIWHQEGWNPRTRRVRLPTFPVPIRQILSYRIHVSNTSPGGQPFMATLLPGDCVVNEWEGYVEVVPLQSILYSLTPIIAQFGLRPPIVMLDFEAGFYFSAMNELLFNTGDCLTYRAQHQFWALTYTQMASAQPTILPPVTPLVYVNGVLASSTTYTVDSTEGQITFTSPQSRTATITASYTYQIPDNVREATIAQVTYLLGMRELTQMGFLGIHEARNGAQQIKRHIRQSTSEVIDEPSIAPLAMQLLQPYRLISIG